MNREVQRNAPGGWMRGLALALAHGGQQRLILSPRPADKRATTIDRNGPARQRAAAEKRARRQSKRARDARRQQEGQQR